MSEPSKVRRTLSRWANVGAQDTRELQLENAPDTASGELRIADAPDRDRVTLRGTVRTLVVRPRGGVPALEAELGDGSGSILVVWLGRRQIAGIEPGRALTVSGRIGRHDGTRTLFNPRYELRA
ncbi:MAG: DNA-binding protein [Nocardioides sp.]|nr:DNA-binding protein [Nocardioides sp.]